MSKFYGDIDAPQAVIPQRALQYGPQRSNGIEATALGTQDNMTAGQKRAFVVFVTSGGRP